MFAAVLAAFVVVCLVNIEVWRRRATTQLRVEKRRRQARERAWLSVTERSDDEQSRPAA